LKGFLLNPLRHRGNALGENYSIDLIVKVLAYGTPALLIVIGFFAYLAGYTVQILTHEAAMMNLGILLMALGIILYIIELAAKIYSYFNG
jgi:hypothetical protein